MYERYCDTRFPVISEGWVYETIIKRVPHYINDAKRCKKHFWILPLAQACWSKLICYWTREPWKLGRLQCFLINSANRCAPRLSTVVQTQLARYHLDEVLAYTTVRTRIWHILSTVCITNLWLQRNRVPWQQRNVTIADSVHEFWESGMKQLRAVAKREYRYRNTRNPANDLPASKSQTTWRAATTGDKLRTITDLKWGAALLMRLKMHRTECR